MRLPRGAVLQALGNGEGSITIPRASNQAVLQALFALPALGFGVYALLYGGTHAWVAFPFFAAGAFVGWMAYGNWKARDLPVILSPAGLLDRRQSAAPIAWPRISQCRLAYARVVTSGVMFLVAAPSGMGAPKPMSVDCLSVGCAPDELLAAIELMRRRWGGGA
jgi:hypothetical protein